MQGTTEPIEHIFKTLTDRQARVMALVAERRTQKEIAVDLDISVGRVSQYVALLKNRFGVSTLGDLTKIYRHLHPLDLHPSGKINLPPTAESAEAFSRDDRSIFAFSDSAAPSQEWLVERRSHVVPEVLDGEHGTLFRAVYMIAVAVGVPVAVVMVITAMSTISDMVSPG